MNIFSFEADGANHQLLQCDDSAISYLTDLAFDATPMAESWQPFRVWWDPSAGGGHADFPGFTQPVLTSRAVEALEDLLRPSGELLELHSDEGIFYLYNVTNVVDCLDEAASSGTRFSSGRFSWIHRHVFREEAVDGHAVFKIPQLRLGSQVYVTGAFSQRVEEAGLRGFAPVEVWSSEHGPLWFPFL